MYWASGMRGSRARRTVRPPKPESKTPMVGVGFMELSVLSSQFSVFSSSLSVWFDGGHGFGCCVGGGVGAEEVGVAGEGVVGLAVDEETDGGDFGECGVKGADDRLHGEGFDLDAGGVIVDETTAEIDDGQLAGLCVGPR